MNVEDLVKDKNFQAVTISDFKKEITGVYIGDLLSFVMGKAQFGEIWATIMSNVNTIAVAKLTDVSCIMLLESVEIEPDVINIATDKNINVIRTQMNAYEFAKYMSVLL